MNQEIQNNFIVEPFKASLIMGKIFVKVPVWNIES